MEEHKLHTIKLGECILDIAAGPFGSNLKVDCFVPKGFPIIDGANLKGIKVTDNVTKFVTDEKARSLHRSIAKRNDIVVTISGNVGQISYIPFDSCYEEYLVSQRQFRVTFDTDKVYVPYLTYYFHTKEGQHKILAFANQTGVPALSQPLKNFRNIDICLPDIEIQRSIASILETIDNKIELNNRINHNLEEQADAIIASLIEENDCKASLRDLAYYINDKTSTTLYSKADYISTENMNPYKAGICVATNLPDGRATSFSKGDTLVSNIRPYFKKSGMLVEMGFVPMIFYALDLQPAPPSTLYHLLRQDSFFDYVMTGAKGSKMPRGDKDQIMKWNIPSISVLCRFEKELAALDAKVIALAHENIILTEQRDLLLPMLVSGEITC